MLKNTSGQKITVYAFDATTNTPKTGDAANISAYVSIDDGALAQLTDTSATEVSSTNAKGLYTFDLAQAETNGTKLTFAAKSSTANIVVLPVPLVVYTQPAAPAADVVTALLAATADTGITVAKALEMLAALACGQASVTTSGANETWTFKMRDGETTSFTLTRNKTTGARSVTGSLA